MWLSLANHICLTFQRKEEVFGTLPGVHAEPDSHILNLTEQIQVKNPNCGVSEAAVSQQCVVAAEPVGEHCGVVNVQHHKAVLHISHGNNILPTALLSPFVKEQELLEYSGCRLQVCMFESQNSIHASLTILAQLKWPQGLQETNEIKVSVCK